MDGNAIGSPETWLPVIACSMWKILFFHFWVNRLLLIAVVAAASEFPSFLRRYITVEFESVVPDSLKTLNPIENPRIKPPSSTLVAFVISVSSMLLGFTPIARIVVTVLTVATCVLN